MQYFGQPPANQYGSAGAFYAGTTLGDAVPHIQKGSFLRGYRRRLNVGPLIWCLLVPWALFVAMYVVTSFEIRYDQPNCCFFLCALGLLAVVIAGATAASSRVKTYASPEHEPSWLFFLALSMLLAWLLGVFMGEVNYGKNLRPYYDMHNLNEYGDVSVKTTRGQQLMDAGLVGFANGTKIDTTRSMGFKSNTVYCVAPITQGKEKLPTYDFWAVGTGCCSGNQADFHCHGYSNTRSAGGLRLMADDSRAYYRLAVQQAEAAYKIKALHPLFFTWTSDAKSTVESWWSAGRTECICWIFSYFVLQCFLVAVATLVFAKLGD